MPGNLKPNKKSEHLYAVIRYEIDAGNDTPIDLRITVKKVVVDPNFAAREVKRLNDLNREKGSYYFYQITRFEDAFVEVESIPPSQRPAEKSQT